MDQPPDKSRHIDVTRPAIAAIIVTHDRPALLRACLQAVLAQDRPADQIFVIDNASGPETAAVLAAFPGVRTLRLTHNQGGAGGFHAGFQVALQSAADFLWVMDDDGRPERVDCLSTLLDRAQAEQADLVGALVLDVERPERLAFPIRIAGKTLFDTASLVRHGPVRGFAHLFNGALIRRSLVERIGLPDTRFFIRGDEVEFLLRARRAGATVLLETAAPFLHPGSSAEIHPIFGGLFYAVAPVCAVKRYYQFRNRAYVFAAYRMWLLLLADIIRYVYYFLVVERFDGSGLAAWAAATLEGLWHEPRPDRPLDAAHSRRRRAATTPLARSP